VNGVFLYTPGGTIREIVAANDTLPGEAQPTAFVPDLPIPVNLSGQVAFGAQVGLGNNSQGFFLRNSDGSTQRIMTEGDTAPSGTDTFGFPHFISGLGDTGNLAFTAATSSASDGIFFAPAAGGRIQTVALDGGPAPGGGTFSLVGAPHVNPPSFVISILANFAEMNGESDVAFAAAIAGGSADSGYFRALHSGSSIGALQPVALQGQAAPGGGTFGTVPISLFSGANFALGPDGALAFVSALRTASGGRSEGMFVARPDGSLLKVAASGDSLLEGETLASLLLSPKSAAGDPGHFAFLANLMGGSAREAIFVTAIPPAPASTMVTLTVSPTEPIAQQPATLTANVTSSVTGTPTGTVTFLGNGVSLGNGTLDATGKATLTISSLAAGPDSFVAQYGGDANFAPANSAGASIAVAGFAPAPASLTVTLGQSVVIPLTLFGPDSNMSFTLSCSGLPAHSNCSFDQSQVTPGANGTTVHLTFSTIASSNLTPGKPQEIPTPPRGLWLSALLTALAAAVSLLCRRVPRWRLASCLCAAAFAVPLLMAGCGATSSYSNPSSNSSPGTPPGPASFTVTATSGATTIPTVVHVNVQ
jgi:hypothetical protein